MLQLSKKEIFWIKELRSKASDFHWWNLLEIIQLRLICICLFCIGSYEDLLLRLIRKSINIPTEDYWRRTIIHVRKQTNKRLIRLATLRIYFSFISRRFPKTQDFNDRPNDEPRSKATYENLETLINWINLLALSLFLSLLFNKM